MCFVFLVGYLAQLALCPWWRISGIGGIIKLKRNLNNFTENYTERTEHRHAERCRGREAENRRDRQPVLGCQSSGRGTGWLLLKLSLIVISDNCGHVIMMMPRLPLRWWSVGAGGWDFCFSSITNCYKLKWSGSLVQQVNVHRPTSRLCDMLISICHIGHLIPPPVVGIYTNYV